MVRPEQWRLYGPGGNIGADIRTIRSVEDINTERADKWKAAVAKYYEADYGIYAERNVRSLYKKLLEVLNIAASVKAQPGWQIRARNPVRETILDKCTAIADEWKKGPPPVICSRGTRRRFRTIIR